MIVLKIAKNKNKRKYVYNFTVKRKKMFKILDKCYKKRKLKY